MEAMEMELIERMRGQLIPAVPVPWTDGKLNEQVQEKYIEYMKSEGVQSAAVWAHTGRGLEIDRNTRMQVLKAWRQGLGPDSLIVAGAGAKPDTDSKTYLANTIAMAQDAASGGADAILVFPPTLYREEPEREKLIYQHHLALSELNIPLILFFLYDEAGGISYSPELLVKLLAIPQVVGIKMATLDSIMTYQDVSRLIEERGQGKLLITGEDRMFPYTMMRGAEAALVGLGSAMPGKQMAMMDAYFEKDWPRFMELARWVDAFAEVTFIRPMEGYILRMLWTLVELGVIPAEAAHDPVGLKLAEAEIENIRSFVRCS
jgi:4-hydroxy-tetrahydrodipicolinate synthase